jgi:phenylpropionate dioxygenase-like ring-hydroxylating dioxygenase large terminal subunit
VVPHAIERPDRIPKERYYDAEFFALEASRLWPRVWQMAARLEQLPEPGDWVTYEILDQSVVVVRGGDGAVRAFQNTCRHRGVRFAAGCGSGAGFTCPFHGWSYGLDGANTFIPRRGTFRDDNLGAGEVDLVPVRCETWGGCAWINLDPGAPPLRASLEPFATVMDAWHLESMRAEWWCAFHLPVNWKLAEEAFMEQYHVLESHPQLRIPGRYPAKDGSFDPAVFLESELHYLHVMSDGMAGMVHATDVAVAERLAASIEPPASPAAWERSLSDAIVDWHRSQGSVIPDLNRLSDAGLNEPMGYAFPHFFVLPMYSSASSYRFRPLGPEETLMEIWSLTRFPPGAEPGPLAVPEPWAHDDPRVPPIPTQDFSNLPKQQQGLHNRGFEFMRLSAGIEGHIGNYHRVIDEYLAGRSPSLDAVNVNPLDRSVVA